MGRPFVVPWEEDGETLFRAYRAAEEPEQRTRLQGLWLLRRGRSLSETAAVVGVTYRTVQRWVTWYREGGLEAVVGHRRGGPGLRPWLSPEQQKQLQERVAQGGFRTAEEIGEWVRKTLGVSYRRGGVYTLMRRLGARKKVPRPFAVKASPSAQAAWKKGGFRRRSRR